MIQEVPFAEYINDEMLESNNMINKSNDLTESIDIPLSREVIPEKVVIIYQVEMNENMYGTLNRRRFHNTEFIHIVKWCVIITFSVPFLLGIFSICFPVD